MFWTNVRLHMQEQWRVKKTEIFQVMEKISAVMVDGTVRIGDIIIQNIVDGVNLVATDNLT